jgi:hypothetical protein
MTMTLDGAAVRAVRKLGQDARAEFVSHRWAYDRG